MYQVFITPSAKKESKKLPKKQGLLLLRQRKN